EDKILDLGSYSAPAFFDFDLDGDKDLVVGITKDYLGTLYLYQNTGTELLPEYKLIDTNWLELSQYNRSPIPAFGDLNNDGLEDLLVGTYKENLIYFKNNGQKLILESLFFDSINVGNSSSPTIADVNYDGLNDLIIGCENGNLFYYENNGKAKGKRFGLVSDSLGKIFTNEISYVGNTPHDTSDIGRSVPCAVDIDKNGTLDLVVGGITGSIKVYKNISNYIHSKARVSENIYFDHSIDTFGLADFGTYTCTAVCNLDGDTMPDIMVGNSRGGFNLMGTKRTTSIVTNNSVYLPSQSAQTSVFPNPTKNELNISVKYTNDNYAYTIVNLLGEEVMKGIVNQNKTTLNIENLPTGMYILKLVNKTEESTIKFVKE
ncbi:MAG: T9SS type A sorting domain-containing protein, partial [Bacteroidetes bacterium]|nr:T9SS type A sorting domain-containing protein [Bacteroidota bacterium]